MPMDRPLFTVFCQNGLPAGDDLRAVCGQICFVPIGQVEILHGNPEVDGGRQVQVRLAV